MKLTFSFLVEKNSFSFILCNSTILSNKKRQKHNNLAQTEEHNSRMPMMSTPRASSLYKPRTQMQTLTRMYMIIIEDFDHMTTIDENAN